MTMTKRGHIRQLKRSISHQSDADAMLALLERSVRFGHKKLALLRCLQAEKMGIGIRPEILHYCQQVVERLPADTLSKLLRQTVVSPRGRA